MNYSSPNTSFTALPLPTTDNGTHHAPEGQENAPHFTAIDDAISSKATWFDKDNASWYTFSELYSHVPCMVYPSSSIYISNENIRKF